MFRNLCLSLIPTYFTISAVSLSISQHIKRLGQPSTKKNKKQTMQMKCERYALYLAFRFMRLETYHESNAHRKWFIHLIWRDDKRYTWLATGNFDNISIFTRWQPRLLFFFFNILVCVRATETFAFMLWVFALNCLQIPFISLRGFVTWTRSVETFRFVRFPLWNAVEMYFSSVTFMSVAR